MAMFGIDKKEIKKQQIKVKVNTDTNDHENIKVKVSVKHHGETKMMPFRVNLIHIIIMMMIIE